jgi:hypothetical protein
LLDTGFVAVRPLATRIPLQTGLLIATRPRHRLTTRYVNLY